MRSGPVCHCLKQLVQVTFDSVKLHGRYNVTKGDRNMCNTMLRDMLINDRTVKPNCSLIYCYIANRHHGFDTSKVARRSARYF